MTAAGLRRCERHYELGDGIAIVETLASRTRLRALSIDSIAATETEWDTLTAAFTALGGELGAKLAREDEF